MSESPPQRTPTGSVLLDIGEGVGALVVYTAPSCFGQEIELSRHSESRRVHTDVLARTVAGTTVFAAVFASLPAGDYLVWDGTSTPVATVTVADSFVTELDLR